MAKYYLIDKTYEILDRIDSVTPGGAKHYFMERKQLKDEEKFDKLWTVITKKEYDLNQEAFQRKPSHQYEWWKDEPQGPDDEFDY
tara:strand:- start:327 stop:581 length:255 start_codon:yes stop_codon:yes gene_type:complete